MYLKKRKIIYKKEKTNDTYKFFNKYIYIYCNKRNKCWIKNIKSLNNIIKGNTTIYYYDENNNLCNLYDKDYVGVSLKLFDVYNINQLELFFVSSIINPSI